MCVVSLSGWCPAQYYYCDETRSDLVYFHSDVRDPCFSSGDLQVRVGLKEKDELVPVCYCFGVRRRDLADEVQRTGKSTITERVKAEVKAGNCACEVKNPSGKCCLGDVIRTAQTALQTAQVGNFFSIST